MDLKQQLWDAFKDQVPIKVTSHYQGFPVSCQANVVMLSRDLLALKVEARLMALARREHRVYLECSSCVDMLKAVPIAFEHRECVAVFDRIGNISPAAMRKVGEIHIRPKEEVPVRVNGSTSAARGKLIDFQPVENGSLFVGIGFDEFQAFERSQPVTFILEEPSVLGVAQLNGEVIRINRQNHSNGIRVLFHLNVSSLIESPLQAYLNARRQEIEAEWSLA